MSTTSRIKTELAALPEDSRCCVTAELGGLILGGSFITLRGQKQLSLSFKTEHAAVLRRALQLFNKTGQAEARPRLLLTVRMAGRRQYHLQLSHQDSHRLLREQGMLRPDEAGEERFASPKRVARRNCCRRAYIRGSFLACGYLSPPGKRYYAEWIYHDLARALRLQRSLRQAGLKTGLSQRRDSQVVSLHGGDQVAELLRVMGASRALMDLENTRAQKSLRENANRAVNCDAANLSRQLSAASRQVAAIEAISRQRGLSSLSPGLETLARLRLANPDASLEQLGRLLEPPKSKSGVAYQIRALMKQAEKLQ